MKTNKLIQLYAKSNLIMDSVFDLSIPPGSKVEDVRTVKNVCGFLVPLKGCANYMVNGSVYKLEPGLILHAGSSMPLSKEVTGREDWEYILIHYKILGDKESKKYLETIDYSVRLPHDQMDKIQIQAKQILKLHKSSGLHEGFKKKVLLYQFIETLLEAKYEVGLQTGSEKMHYIAEYMKTNLDQVLIVSDLAERVDMSEKSFAYLFSKTIGLSPKKYLMSLRIKKAEQLLLSSQLQISEIALNIGCEDPLYFSRMFKKNKGVSPSEFRRFFGKSPY